MRSRPCGIRRPETLGTLGRKRPGDTTSGLPGGKSGAQKLLEGVGSEMVATGPTRGAGQELGAG